MSFDEIERLWRAPQNAADLATLERHDRVLRRRLSREHRRFVALMSAGALVFVVLLARFAVYVARGGAFELEREWGSIVTLLAPLAALVLFWRRHVQHRRHHSIGAGSIRETLHALLDANRLERQRLRVISWLHVGFALCLPIVVLQLRAVGKAGDEVLVPALVVWPVMASAIVLSLRWYRRRQLEPRGRQLEELLRSYG